MGRSAKKMGYIIYRCSDDFPAKIPAILSSLPSPASSKGGGEIGSDFDASYSYQVERGMGRISIRGSREDGFMSVVIATTALNPLRWRSSFRLGVEVTAALLEAGMKEVTVEELEEFEALRKQKEAEQFVDDNLS